MRRRSALAATLRRETRDLILNLSLALVPSRLEQRLVILRGQMRSQHRDRRERHVAVGHSSRMTGYWRAARAASMR